MRNFVSPIAATAALVFVAADATPAKAQIVISGGYVSPGYYGGYTPYYGGPGVVLGVGGLGFNASPLYGGFGNWYGGYSGYGGYGYRPYYGGRYRSYYGGGGYGYRSYYGGGRGYGGRRHR